MKQRNYLFTVFIVVFMILGGCEGGGGGDDSSPSSVAPSPAPAPVVPTSVNTVDLSLGSEVSSVAAQTVGASGGVIAVTDSSDPLFGFEIEVPEGATDEDISFSVSSSDITDVDGLPAEAAIHSRLIKIAATGSDDWNTYGMFNKAIKVTLPYDDTDDAVSWYVHNQDKTLESTGMAATDPASNTITFWTRTFANSADTTVSAASIAPASAAMVSSATVVSSSVQYATYMAIGLSQQIWADWTNVAKTIDTGFKSASNGWYIPNYGSFYKESRGGNCFGMVGLAKYYYKTGASPTLYSNYRDDLPTSTWVDDEVAIELASRVHNGMSDIWSQYVNQELDIQTASSVAVARSLVGALYITGSPALLGIYQEVAGDFTGGHAIMTYRADIDASGNITFYLYDPNFPSDDTRRINYISGTGFQNYASGTTAESSAFSYNNISHVGFHVGLSDAALAAMKTSADQGFQNDSVFPTITITSITGKTTYEDVTANESTTAQGQHKYTTPDTAVIISGTVLGGLAQTDGSVVDNIRVLTPGGNYSTAVDNRVGGGTGRFSITVPLLHGENMIAFIAARRSSLSHWAAFDMDIIESTASASSMTVTLDWGQGSSDVDLYVKEPDGDGKTGSIVYYSYRRGISLTNPYLDFDNRSGFGPEHYLAKRGMVTLYDDGTAADSLYGDYTIGVHYYDDSDLDDDADQPISWNVNWRYLAFCAEPCVDPDSDGFWVSGSQSGSLSDADSGQDGPGGFYSGGSAWSAQWNISYPEPDPTDYEVPDSHTIMLP